jgi:phosphatidylglycerophosphatase A
MSATVESTPSTTTRSKSPLWATLVATFFGIGLLRPGPGTWGSAVTVLAWAVAAHWISISWQTLAAVLLAAFVVAIGIPAATVIARSRCLKDPQFVVIDEVAGQFITLIGVPLNWKSLLAGFILFRVFDILKPYPIRRLEQLPEGTGIVIDDVGAGLYAFICMHLLLHFGLLIR